MTNKNNNEEWRGEFRNKFYPYDFANKGDEVFWQENVKWSEVIDFIAFQISQAEQRGKREEQDRIFEEGWKMMEYNHKSENQWDGLVCANIRINTIQMLLDRVREPLNCSQSKNNQLK